MSLFTAIATATVFALFGFPFRYYQCWYSFSRVGTTVGTVLYLALAGGGGGLLGWAAAAVSHARPTPSDPLNGLLYGVAGALALRADFRARPKGSLPAPDQFKDARSALTASINWTADQLDDITYRKAETWLSSLPDDELSSEAWRVQAHVAAQPDVSDKAKNEMSKKLVPAMEKLANPLEKRAGRAHLITFCASYYRKEHLPRTPRMVASGDQTGGLSPSSC
jgi:hypothetical protein